MLKSLFQCWIVVGILAGKTELHKELLNCPQALWVPHLPLYPFNISYPSLNRVLAKCLRLSCWNMNDSVHLPIYQDASGKQL